MGFKLGRAIELRFDGAMEGAEVNLRPTSVDVTLELIQDMALTRAAELLAEYVTGWNFDGVDGQPLPITAEAVLGNMELVVLRKVMAEWTKAATGVSAPLDPPSGDGGQPETGGSTTSVDSSMAEIPQMALYPQS